MEKITLEQLAADHEQLKKEFKALAHFVFANHFNSGKNLTQLDTCMVQVRMQDNKRKPGYNKVISNEEYFKDSWTILKKAAEKN